MEGAKEGQEQPLVREEGLREGSSERREFLEHSGSSGGREVSGGMTLTHSRDPGQPKEGPTADIWCHCTGRWHQNVGKRAQRSHGDDGLQPKERSSTWP